MTASVSNSHVTFASVGWAQKEQADQKFKLLTESAQTDSKVASEVLGPMVGSPVAPETSSAETVDTAFISGSFLAAEVETAVEEVTSAEAPEASEALETAVAGEAADATDPEATAEDVRMGYHRRVAPLIGTDLFPRRPIGLGELRDNITLDAGTDNLRPNDLAYIAGLSRSESDRIVRHLGSPDGTLHVDDLLVHLERFTSRDGTMTRASFEQGILNAANNLSLERFTTNGREVDVDGFIELARRSGLTDPSDDDLEAMFDRAARSSWRGSRSTIDMREFQNFFGLRVDRNGDFSPDSFARGYERQERPWRNSPPAWEPPVRQPPSWQPPSWQQPWRPSWHCW